MARSQLAAIAVERHANDFKPFVVHTVIKTYQVRISMAWTTPRSPKVDNGHFST